MLKRVVHSLGLVEHREKGSRRKNHQRRPSPELYSQSKEFVVKITHAGGHQELYRHAVPASKLMTKYPGMCVARPEVFKVPHQSVLWREEILVPGHKYILISFRDVEKLKRKIIEEEKSKEGNNNGVVLETKTRSPKDRVQVPNGVAGHETLDTWINSGNSPKETGKMKEPNGVAGQGVLERRTNLSPKGQGSNSAVKETVDTNMDGSINEGGAEDSFYSAKDFYVRKEKSTTPRPSRRKGIKGKKPFVAPLPKLRPYRSLGWQPSLPTVKELSP
ncbi:unnamed protein product [Sphenostylis stenocarpa]|uniref:Uncharacterized protein n=1 Tax=Sphenostylis stenocarpa TaxID=92480 RepID=A0AA86S9P0_9FABA|nr:unnamed protein product [Sphenostylis stenocarpa]